MSGINQESPVDPVVPEELGELRELAIRQLAIIVDLRIEITGLNEVCAARGSSDGL